MAKASVDVDPSEWVDRHGDFLFGYARSRLRDQVSAEEVVQETFVSALSALKQYSGKGTERAWLLGVLKRKIVDYIRRRNRFESSLDSDDDIEQVLFKSNGKWKIDPRICACRPEAAVERAEFWRVLDSCLDSLPARQRDVFALREIEGMSSHDICSELGISASNLWVLLYRARLRLGPCMSSRWPRA